MAEHVIHRDPVSSSNIKAIGYHATDQVLAVEFNNGTILHLAGVPFELAREFKAAPSKGQFFHRSIRGKFQGSRIDDRPPANCPRCGATGVTGFVCEDCGCSEYGAVVSS